MEQVLPGKKTYISAASKIIVGLLVLFGFSTADTESISSNLEEILSGLFIVYGIVDAYLRKVTWKVNAK